MGYLIKMENTIENFIKNHIEDINSSNWGKLIKDAPYDYDFNNELLYNFAQLFNIFKECNIVISEDKIKEAFKYLGYDNNCKIISLYNKVKSSDLKTSENILSSILDTMIVNDFINKNESDTSLYEIIVKTKKLLGNDIDIFEPYHYEAIKSDTISNPVPIEIKMYYEGMDSHLILEMFIGEARDTTVLYYDNTMAYFVPGFGIAINTQLFNNYVNKLLIGLN